MNRISFRLTLGSLLTIAMVGHALAQAPGTANPPPSAQQSKKVVRPKGLNSASEYLRQHGSSVLGLSASGAGAGGGGIGGGKTQNPLGQAHSDPSTYQKKRQAPKPAVPKARPKTGKPKVLAPDPTPRGQVRRDRSFVNGIAPQSDLYGGKEGGRVVREADPRASLAKATPPARSKAGPGRRPTTSTKPRSSPGR